MWKIARFFKTETHLVRKVVYHFTFLQNSLMAGLEKGHWILISASEFTLQSVLLIDVPRETVDKNLLEAVYFIYGHFLKAHLWSAEI